MVSCVFQWVKILKSPPPRCAPTPKTYWWRGYFHFWVGLVPQVAVCQQLQILTLLRHAHKPKNNTAINSSRRTGRRPSLETRLMKKFPLPSYLQTFRVIRWEFDIISDRPCAERYVFLERGFARTLIFSLNIIIGSLRLIRMTLVTEMLSPKKNTNPGRDSALTWKAGSWI